LNYSPVFTSIIYHKAGRMATLVCLFPLSGFYAGAIVFDRQIGYNHR